MVIQRVVNIGKTLWTHKKKSAVGGVALFFLGRYLLRLKRDAEIRSVYAHQACKFGHEPISEDDRPRRVTVLVNPFAAERRVFDYFKANALPLLHLAGLEVNVITTESEDQLEAIAAAIDTTEADALYVVGGDGALSRVLSGIFRNREEPPLPIGVFPGGNENRSLLSLVPNVFSVKSDVRRYCESAMALIEETKRPVSVVRCQLEGFEEGEDLPRPVYGLSDFSAGWFLHTELKKKKLWYWGGLKRRFAYFWEMLKRYPEKMEVSVAYEEFCPGCNLCRPFVKREAPQWRWWHWLVGAPRYKDDGVPKKDFSAITNELCGKKHKMELKASDIYAETIQEDDTCKLRLRTGGSEAGRFQVMRKGWERCRADLTATSPDESFYENDLFAKSLLLSFNHLPEFIRMFSLFGEVIELNGDLVKKKIRLEATDKKVEIYLPLNIRLKNDQL